MTIALLAQAGAAFTLAHWLIIAIVIAGIIGIAMVILRQSGIAIPPFVLQIFWIVLVVVIGVIAIKFLIGMM